MPEDNEIAKLAMIVVAIGLLAFVGFYASVQYTTDNDCDGTPALFDRDDSSGTVVCGTPTKPKNPNPEGAVVITKPGTTPAPSGTPTIEITSISVENSLLTKGGRLEPMLYVLPPGSEIKEVVRFKVTGGKVNDVTFSFSLLPGTLDKGAGRHLPGEAPMPQDKVTKDTLIASQNEYAVTLKGRVPAYNPGHDWYLPIIEISAPGMATPITQTNWRDDDPTKPKWLTLAYPNDWRNIPPDTRIDLVDTTLGPDGMQIDFTRSAFVGLRRNVDTATIYQITYAGKYLKLWDGPVPNCGESQFILKTILGACILQFGETRQTIYLPAKDMASVGPNEAYLKITTYGDADQTTQESTLLDLNTAEDDIAARVNIDQQVVGGKSFSGSEYFSVFGANPRLGFSVLGGGGHPEAKWFG